MSLVKKSVCTGAVMISLMTALVLGVFSRKDAVITSVIPTRVSTSSSEIVYPNTYTAIQPFMEGIYAADHRIIPPLSDDALRGMIIPHHLVASASIAAGIKILQRQPIKHILLVSPDHFRRCKTLVCTVDARYQTFFGEVQASSTAVQHLLMSPLVSQNQALFQDEHGIFADLPFIAHYLPGVPVTPLALSQVLPWKAQREELRDLIDGLLDQGTVIVVSSDFSHYLSLRRADDMDRKTERALREGGLETLASLRIPDQTDCANCLWTLVALAKKRSFAHPFMIAHTNSARLLGDARVTETTSHYTMLWSEHPMTSTEMLPFNQ